MEKREKRGDLEREEELNAASWDKFGSQNDAQTDDNRERSSRFLFFSQLLPQSQSRPGYGGRAVQLVATAVIHLCSL